MTEDYNFQCLFPVNGVNKPMTQVTNHREMNISGFAGQISRMLRLKARNPQRK